MQVEDLVRESIAVKEKILQDKAMLEIIEKVSEVIIKSLQNNGKILFCGNGGSASDAQHLASEFIGRFQCERSALPAISLCGNTSMLTAVANDYGYQEVFARAVEGLMKPEDVLVGISTSGNSENIYRAILKAKEASGSTVVFVGKTGGKISEPADYSIIVPSDCTARIQECHIMIGHIICEVVEKYFMSNRKDNQKS